MSDPLITEKDLNNLIEQLKNVRGGDKDRIRLLNAAMNGFTFNTDQIQKLVLANHFGNAITTAAINLYSKCVDPENYSSKVLPKLPYEEDRKEVREALGI